MFVGLRCPISYNPLVKRYLRNAIIGLGAVAAGVLINEALHPWYTHWGATDAEISRAWPGDEPLPGRSDRCTRAITINAPVEQVWPWIVQIGQDRGGFYSYTWLENLALADMHNADRIMPEFQTRFVGDSVWMTPSYRYGGKGRMTVVQLVPNRAMVLVMPPDVESVQRGLPPQQGIWQFLLEPVDEHSTRLVMRGVGPEGFNLFRREIFDPGHFIMERKMMLGIKARAEGNQAFALRSKVDNTEQSCRHFVQEFYDWYLPMAQADNQGPAWNLALKYGGDAFSPELSARIQEDSDAQSKADEIVGLDFDPFLNSQDPSEQFLVESITRKGDTCSAEVRGIQAGQREETVLPEIMFKDGRWIFVDFHYDNNSSLLEILKQLREDRRKMW
jgi:hypothetical protein